MSFSNFEQLLNIHKFSMCETPHNLYDCVFIKYSCLNEVINLEKSTFSQGKSLYLVKQEGVDEV